MRLGLAFLALLAACTGGSAADPDAAAVSPDAPPASCPAAPPAAGSACASPTELSACIYDRCASDGEIVEARCDAGSWTVTISICDQLTCQGDTCTGGQICTAQSGGALLVECRTHACGDGPLTCDCACGGGDCEATGASDGDSIFTCYLDCGADICP